MTLLDLRDELAATRNLAAALHMACDARSMPGDQRAALCELGDSVRVRLAAIIAALDQIIAGRPKRAEAASD